MNEQTTKTIVALMVAATVCSVPLLFGIALTIGFFSPLVDNKEIFPIVKQALPYITGGLLTLLGQLFEQWRAGEKSHPEGPKP
jgi:hypothetical protein